MAHRRGHRARRRIDRILRLCGVERGASSMTSKPAKITRKELREMARRLRASNTSKLFGFDLQSAGAGCACISLKVRPHHIQLHDVVHGGILAALADTTGAIAAYTVVPRGTHLATVELKINYLEPVVRGTIVAEARVLRRGRNFIISECDIFGARRNLAAKSLMTFAIGPVIPSN